MRKTRMWPSESLAALALLGCIAAVVAQDDEKTYLGRYMVVAPKSVRPGSPLSVSVELLRDLPSSVELSLQLRDAKNASLSQAAKKGLRLNDPTTVDVPPPRPGALNDGGQYFLYVKGSAGGRTLFEEQTELTFNSKSLSIFVQTDKAKYKPGGKVKYRVVVVGADLRPYSGRVEVKVVDPMENVLALLEDQTLDRGVLSRELPLSEEPPLGSWRIDAKTPTGDEFSKTFEVEKYVLPKFSVEILPPDVALIGDELRVTAKAKYTYGKPLEGLARIEVRQPWEQAIWEEPIFFGPEDENGPPRPRRPRPPPPPMLEASGELEDGEFTATFSSRDLADRNLVREWGGQVKVVAAVTEELTGIARKEEEMVTFHRHRHEFAIDKSSEHFKPGLPFSVRLAVTTKDSKPLRQQDPKKVKLEITYTMPREVEETPPPPPEDDEGLIASGFVPPPPGRRFPRPQPPLEKKEMRMVQLDADGTKTVELKPPAECENINVQGFYMANGDIGRVNTTNLWQREDVNKRVISAGAWVQKALSASDAFLAVVPEDAAEVPAGTTKRFRVTSTERLGQLSYRVMSRGLVLLASQVAMNGKTGAVSVPTTASMAPKATLVVFSVLPANKEVLVDAVDFTVSGMFANEVSVTMDKSEAEPGEGVSVRVTCERGSLINVLGVDQSVLLLASGNDLTAEVVAEDVEQYDSRWGGGCCGPFPFRGRRKRSSWIPWGVSGRDPKSIFKNAGLVVLTDAWVFEEPRPDWMNRGFGGGGPMVMEAAAAGEDMEMPMPAPGAPPQAQAGFAASGPAGGRGGGGAPAQPPKLRKDFPETWLWEDADARREVSVAYGQYYDRAPMYAAAPEDQMDYELPSNVMPVAAPAASSWGPEGPPGPAKAPAIRSFFPETWLWVDNAAVRSASTTTFKARVPDTISSFVVSAFAVSAEAGLGVAASPASLKVFRPFFAQLNLPYSVKRGEKLAVQALVFNYLPTDQTVTLRLKPSTKFRFVEKSGVPIKRASKQKMEAVESRRVVVKAGGSAAVFFPIVATALGSVPLELEALGDSAGDRLRKPLLVEPEGYRVEGNLPLTIDLSKTPSFKRTLQADIPLSDPGFVEGSVRTKVSLIGDVMAPVLQNIDDLVRMPYGCGEQNMINFVPNIVVMKYLSATQRLEPALETKAKGFMEAGYQRELQYKRQDHSFSAFGDSDPQGSTWLTAFVVRSFHQAKPYIFIDPKVMNESIGYLREMQKRSGEYEEKHAVIHGELSGGGAEEGVPLTAYVVTTMLENGERDAKGVAYLEQKLPSIRSPYSLALVTYALHLARSSAKERAWQMLQRAAKREDGFRFWAAKEEAGAADKPRYWSAPPPANVEMTAYALHSYMLRASTEEALPVVRWLAGQRNAQGGWSSTQDTVVALSSLGEYAAATYAPDFDADLRLANGRTKARSFTVNPANALKLQTFVARDVRKPVTISATGKGTVFAQLSWSYNLKTDSDNAPFACTAKEVGGGKGASKTELTAEFCCSWKRSGESGMAVLEAEALSGYEFDADATAALTELTDLQRAELTKSDTQANLYFDKLTGKPMCFRLKSALVALVAEQKPSQIRLYDYYRPQDRLEMKWSRGGPPKGLAETCPDCWPADSLLAPANRCRDQYGKCDGLCQPDRLDSKTYMKYARRHQRWLSRFCRRSCATIFDINQCFA